MVDITHCVRCGRPIPALDIGCAHCESDERARAAAEELDETYLPLAIKLLLRLFGVLAAVTAVLAVLTMLRNAGPSLSDSVIVVLAALRFLLAGTTVLALFMRPSWGRLPALTFAAAELAQAIAIQFGWLEAHRWAGGIVAPLWTVLFVLVLLREDVAAHFDRRVADRRAVGDLLRSMDDEARR